MRIVSREPRPYGNGGMGFASNYGQGMAEFEAAALETQARKTELVTSVRPVSAMIAESTFQPDEPQANWATEAVNQSFNQ